MVTDVLNVGIGGFVGEGAEGGSRRSNKVEKSKRRNSSRLILFNLIWNF